MGGIEMQRAHFSGEDDEGGFDGVGHGDCVVGKHLGQAGGRHEAWRGAGRWGHNPVNGLCLLTAIPPCALHQHSCHNRCALWPHALADLPVVWAACTCTQ